MEKKNSKMGGLWTGSYGAIGATLKALEDNGVTLEHLAWLRAEPNYAKRVAKVILQGLNENEKSSVDQKLMHKIMGKNFFGIEEAIKYFGIKPTVEQLFALAKIPFTEEELYEVKDTHILVAVFPISIIDMQYNEYPNKARVFTYGSILGWYLGEQFAKECGTTSWQLIRMTPAPESTSKTWNEQQELLGDDEETPAVRTMVYTIIGYKLMTGIWLFGKINVRCANIDSKGNRVHIGSADYDRLSPGGIDIDASSDVNSKQDLGLAVSRKIPIY